MKRLRVFIIIFSSCLVFAMPVLAKPIEVKSENFIFYGDVSEKSAISLIEGLEEYREIIFTLLNTEAHPEVIPVKIIAVRSPERVAELTGSAGAGGVYVSNLEGPVFVLNSKGGFRQGKPARQIALHEYTHHLLAGYTNEFYPRWYNEGFAEYLSTFEVSKKGVISIGLPNDGRAYALTNKSWIPMDVFVGAVRKYPYPNSDKRSVQRMQSLFYSQSWLAVHYIQSTKGYPEKFIAYLKLLNQFDAPADAFEQSFEMTPEAFGEILKAYFKKNRYLTSRITLRETYVPATPSVRKIEEAELAFQIGDAARHFRRRKDEGAFVLEKFDEALDEGGDSARISATKALMALRADDRANAKDLAEAAFRENPNSLKANLAMGAVLLDKYQAEGGPENLKQARARLKAAMRLDPNYIYAHYLYARTYYVTHADPSRQAVASAKEALRYYRSERFLGSNLEMASVLLNADEYSEARRVFEQATIWAPSPRLRRHARNILAEIGHTNKE